MRPILNKIWLLILETITYFLLFFSFLFVIYMMGMIFSKLIVFDTNILFKHLFDSPYLETTISFIPQVIIYIYSIHFLRKWFFKRNFAESGFSFDNFIPSLSFGFGWGFIFILTGFLTILVFGEIEMSSPTWDGYLFLGELTRFCFQSFSEEVMLRGFLAATIAYYFGKHWAIFLSSMVFSLLHFANPNFGLIPSLTIFLSGIAMGILFFRFNNIWACTGLHWAWNFFQATLFDFNVSGFDVYSFIRFKPLNPIWFSGGSFGFEGSIVSVIPLVLFCGWQWQKLLKTNL